jgi:hypothetical protein
MSDLAALQAALAAEQATVWGYGVAGSVLRGVDRGYATAALEAHTLLRDRLMTMISGLGATPVAALPAYRLPQPVTDQATARQLAAHLEEGGAGALWDLIAASTPNSDTRSFAIGQLARAALRATYWGAEQALPGQPA